MHRLHTTIVGAGIIGLATAYALLRQNVQVTLVEQAHIDHRYSSSHGLSRLLRFEYGSDALYSTMVQTSLERWHALEDTAHQQLFTQTGLLALGNEHDQEIKDSYDTLCRLGYTLWKLSSRECRQRYPQFQIDNNKYSHLFYNPCAGILHASTCLQTLRRLVLSLGGEIREHQQVISVEHTQGVHPLRLHLQSGETFASDRCVIAAGPWIHMLLGDLHLPVQLTRQYLLYFSQLPEEDRFASPFFPCFMADDLYGFPLHHSYNRGQGPHWLKIASHAFGSDTTPTEAAVIDQHVIQQILENIYKLFPSLRHAQLASVEPCIYDVTPDEDFILDYAPGDHSIIIASGMSGHAFKFAPLLGEMIGSLVTEQPSTIPLSRFSLQRFSSPYQPHTDSVA